MVRKINGLPQDVQGYMMRALKGALDYVITDIQPGADQQTIDFVEPVVFETFFTNVGENLFQRLSNFKKEKSEDQKYQKELIYQIMEKVGEQMRNVEGPDFEALTGIGAMVIMDESDVREIMEAVKDSIVEGTSKVVMDMKLEQRFQRAAINALQDGMRGAAAQFE
jgi:hypothetical protein